MISEVNWKEYSQNFDEITVEVGFGKSCTILELANLDSYSLYIGIEILNHFCQAAQFKTQVGNVIIVNSDILIEIKEIPSESISRYLVFFPSPPIEQRIFSSELHDQIFRTLKKNGVIKVVTDDRKYYSFIVSLFSDKNWIHIPWTPMPFINDSSELLVATECEIEYGAKYYLECYKR